MTGVTKAGPESGKSTTGAARPTLFGALRAAISSWWGPGPVAGRVESSDELAADRTDMAVTRTLLAADRTLMAWVRTSLSLSSFGFTIYKVLQGLASSGVDLPRRGTPTYVGLFLTGMGTVAIVLGVVEFAQTLRELRTFTDVRLIRPALVLAILIAGMGLFLFVSIFARLA